MSDFIPCFIKNLPAKDMQAAAENAIKINPANAPRFDAKAMSMFTAASMDVSSPEFLILITQKYWGPGGKNFSVKFLDNPTSACRSKILAHMNAWKDNGVNMHFVESNSDAADVRIDRIDQGQDRGYWSYVGTDIKLVQAGRPTMNLQGFTEHTSEAEYTRVVRHETGHTMGFDHEHLRKELIKRIDPNKAYAYFAKPPNRWNRDQVDRNVLTSIEDQPVMSTEHADQDSIMCYHLPGEITKDGEPIIGGTDIDAADAAFAALLYPGGVAEVVEKPVAGRAIQISLEDFFTIAARAGRAALNPQPLPPKGKIFVGIVASEE